MRWGRWLLATLICGSLAAARLGAAEPAVTTNPTLQLANGDFLAGELADSAEPNFLFWKCAVAARPFEFPLSALSAAHFPHQAAAEGPTSEYAVELSGGDMLFGSLASLSPEALELDSPRFGRVRIERRQVRRLARRSESSGVEYQGPEGLTGWTIADKSADQNQGRGRGNARDDDGDDDRVESVWTEESGHIIAEKPGAIVLADIHIPMRASIEVELSWKRKGDFSIDFGGGQGEGEAKVARAINRIVANQGQTPKTDATQSMFSLEVWNRSLVLVRERNNEADLARVKYLAAGAGSIQLRLFFDNETGTVTVYSVDGKQLGDAQALDKTPVLNRGIRLVNKQGDVRLEHLAVRQWIGALPQVVDHNHSHIQLADGSVQYGDAPRYDADRKEFLLKSKEGADVRLAAANVERVVFGDAEELTGVAMRAALHDGARLSGDLQGIAGGKLSIRRPGIAGELVVPAAELRSLMSLQVETPTVPPGRLGTLKAEGVQVRGVLIDGEPTPGASCLVWQPQWSRNGSPLVLGASASIVFRELPPRPKPDEQRIAEQGIRQRAIVRPAGVFGIVRALGGGGAQLEPVAAGGESRGQLLWLRGGDRIPCELVSVDERGLTFKSSVINADFLPHDSILAWERFGGSQPQVADEKKRERLLTLPRMQRENPPTHLIESRGGDFLRGRLESLDDKTLQMEVRLEPKSVARDRVVRIIWLHSEKKSGDKEADDAAASAQAAASAGEEAAGDDSSQVQAVRRDGVRLSFAPARVSEGNVIGASRLLGDCRVSVAEVDQLLLGDAIATAAADLLYASWQLKHALDPRYLTAEDGSGGPGAAESSLIGTEAPDFKLKLIAGGQFELSKERGKVVVLDFWASWCGPCMQSMPQLEEVAQEMGGAETRFIAVNLQEDRKTIEDALERLEIKTAVAMDVDGAAAEKFAVRAIPQTVVIDREGKIATVLVGGRPDYAETLRAAVQAALTGVEPGAADQPGT